VSPGQKCTEKYSKTNDPSPLLSKTADSDQNGVAVGSKIESSRARLLLVRCIDVPNGIMVKKPHQRCSATLREILRAQRVVTNNAKRKVSQPTLD
jgi:hypothetical protein